MASVPCYPRKHDALAVEESPAAGDGVASRVERPTTPTSSVSVARLPLSALRVTLDEGSAQARLVGRSRRSGGPSARAIGWLRS